MKFLHFLSSFFWLSILVIACNTTPGEEKKPDEAKGVKEIKAETSLEGETFPETGGFKGRTNNQVFYVDAKDSGVSGFVRYKDSKKENKLVGKKMSPFDFECEELDENDELVSKLRGKVDNDELGAEIEYNEANSSNTFRFKVKK